MIRIVFMGAEWNTRVGPQEEARPRDWDLRPGSSHSLHATEKSPPLFTNAETHKRQ
jgi:hypothetical protein